MASIRPATLMGMPTAGGIMPGAPADFVLFHREGAGFVCNARTNPAARLRPCVIRE